MTPTVGWSSPTNVIVGTIIPAGPWIYVGPPNGAVNVAAAHGSGGVTTADYVISDGTMTATVAGIIYPVTWASSAIGAQSWQQRQIGSMPMRSLGAAATPRSMLPANWDDDDGDWSVEQTIVNPGQSANVWSDGWNVRVCGNGKAMLIKLQ